MKKHITIENNIYEATLILSTEKTNDEFVPINRKTGVGGDKNHYFVSSVLYSDFETFFPGIVKDKKENVTNRNNVRIRNYFSISNILNDLGFINEEIKKKYKNEVLIDKSAFLRTIFSIAKEQDLNTNFYIQSDLGSADNGIGFKNWDNSYSSTIKQLLLHTTKTKVYLFRNKNEICAYFEFNQYYEKQNLGFELVLRKEKLLQKIFFGAPGTGKSYKVQEMVAGKEERTERVTFHPEFDYSSFVGGYKPVMRGNDIRYEFVPQTFSNIYVRAWNDIENDYYLVIEEINRGNCAEIFGDVFQLLDRNNEYKITPSKELGEYLSAQFIGNNNIDGNKLILPPNLNILATMNTSDQSLFPMDSAFKRRWDWEYIPIDYNKDRKLNESANYSIVIDSETRFNWIDFLKAINSKIQDNHNLGMDKCIGNYFVKPNSNNEIDIDSFIHKVLFYLWNDVFKDEPRNSIFEENESYQSFFPISTDGVSRVKMIFQNLGLNTISELNVETLSVV